MKETNTNESMFDSLFKEGLADKTTPVPPGVWEGVASSIGSGAGAAAVTGTAVQMAGWLKAVIAVSVIGAASYGTWTLLKDTPAPDKSVTEPAVQQDNNIQPQDQPSGLSEPGEDEISPEQSPVQRPEKPPTVEEWIKEHAPHTGHSDPSTFWHTPQPEEHPTVKGSDNQTPAPLIANDRPEDNPEKGDRNAAGQDEPEPAPAEQLPPPVKDSSYIFIPNTFTCDGDGINDTYLINIVNDERVEIVIYDPRTNDILFRTRNKYQAWNGNLPNGEPAPAGSYIVKVIYKFKGKKEARPEFVKLTLIR